MRLVLSSAASSLILALGISVATAAEATPSDVARLFFPETSGWVSLTDVPSITKQRLLEIRDQLRATYVASGVGRRLEVEGCSVIQRVLWDEDAKLFHLMDVNQDGFQDIVYSDNAQCREGDVTLIWFGKAGGFSMNSDSAWDAKVLRIAPGNVPRISSVAVGCCGDLVDEYNLGTLENFRIYSVIRTTQITVLPKRTLSTRIRFKNSSSMTVRSTPRTENAYDENLSGLMSHAVFGNVLCKYIAGASGTILAEQRERDGKTWDYVVMDPTSEVYRVDDPFRANVGWVEKSSIKGIQ